jgi:hypothetical protein
VARGWESILAGLLSRAAREKEQRKVKNKTLSQVVYERGAVDVGAAV